VSDAFETGAAPDEDPGQPRIQFERLTRFIETLELDALGGDCFRAENPDPGYGVRVFGGQVAGQAIQAAVRTVDVDHHVHSMHAYFLRPGKPGVPIDYDVERTRDGRSFTTRRVLARQGDEVIFEMSASFHTTEDGVEYQLPIGPVPDPEDTPINLLFAPREAAELMPWEMRELGATEPDEHGWHSSSRRAWMRCKGRLPDDPLVHLCLLTYLSDMGAMFAAMAPDHGFHFGNVQGASLDHAMWFHRPLRADEWFLYDLHTVSNAGARGLARGTMHSADGVLGVSMVQEALIRRLE